MRIIAIVNQKGGSGKTTTSVNLAAALAEQARRVLLIDLDPQHSTTLWMSIHDVGRGVFDLFAEPESTSLDSLVRATSTPNVSLVGASNWLTGTEKALANEPGAETILRSKLEELGTDQYDYVLFDCPPTLGILTLNALTATHELLIPVECHVMGLQGLAQILLTIERVRKRLNPSIRVGGIVACRLDQRTKHGVEIVAKLRERFRETYQTAIRENIRLAECPSMGVPITTYAPTSNGAEDYRALGHEVLQQEERSNHEEAANE